MQRVCETFFGMLGILYMASFMSWLLCSSLFIFVPLYFFQVVLYWLVDTQESLISRHSTWPTCTLWPSWFHWVTSGHWSTSTSHTHTRHRSNIFHLVPKLVSKLCKNGGPFFKLQPAPKKIHRPHTLPRNTSSIVAVSQHLVKFNQLQELSIRFCALFSGCWHTTC